MTNLIFKIIKKKEAVIKTMRTLIKEGTVLLGTEYQPEKTDIYIEDNNIVRIGKNLDIEADEVINAKDLLITPGLVNAHLHSDENLFKAQFDNLPLELWMLYTYPTLMYGPFSKRLIYLRTMLGAIEMVKHGVTLVQDDVSEYPKATLEGTDAVMEAYSDIGMRSSVTTNLCDKQWKDKLPYISDMLPQDIKEAYPPAAKKEELYELLENMIEKWHEPGGMTNVVLAPVAPQRCTDEFFQGMHRLGEKYDLPIHTHVLETKMQQVTGKEFYGTTLIEHMNNIGVLSDRTTIVHSVWLTDHDIELIAKAGASVVHNPISNLKLGSGIMPYAKIKEAGINIALGTDGMSSNDNQSIFEVMKISALLHKVTSPDYSKWPDAHDIYKAATFGGAKSTRRNDHVGFISENMRADLVFFDMNTAAFTPTNDLIKHLVYCENGDSIVRVMINGKTVVKDHEILTIDEKSLLRELSSMMDDFRKDYVKTKEWADKLFPYVDEVYWKSYRQSTGLNRLAGNEMRWIDI